MLDAPFMIKHIVKRKKYYLLIYKQYEFEFVKLYKRKGWNIQQPLPNQ